jgi:phytoene dehydrogenase-like protein
VGLDRIENWADLATEAKRTRKERWMDRIIADLDRQYPGIAGAIVQREMSTAETFHQHLNTPGGALYGFAPESRQFMPLAETAIGGLYLASAFTGGGGFTGANSRWGVGGKSGSEISHETRNVTRRISQDYSAVTQGLPAFTKASGLEFIG